MAINLHEKHSAHIIERFKKQSITQGSFDTSLDMEFVGVKTVKVSSIATVPMNDYNRTAANNRYGAPTELQDTDQELTMTQDRAYSTTIDKGNNMEQQMIKKAGAAARRQLDEVVTPEIDTYRLSKWAEGAGTTKTITAPTKTTVFGLIMDAMVVMDNELVPKTNRTLYVGSKTYSALLQSSEFLSLEKTGNKAVSQGEIGQVLGMTVKYVPDSYLPAGVQFMVVHKGSAISPVKLHEYKIHVDPPGLSGHLVEGRYIYDAFVLDAKKMGVYVAKTSS